MSPKAVQRFVAYYRVSTERQGKSGLGLEAQQHAVATFINGGAELVAEFTETESGKQDERPELAKAMAACRCLKAKLAGDGRGYWIPIDASTNASAALGQTT